ncbi:MAG TPA: hypothetical protein VJM50_23740 [Pyrinomonadaceae bacterium]|nr:hypothetical protein [Pyrinomonadaceae bacterium]
MAEPTVDVLCGIDRLIGNTRTMAGLTGDPRLRDHLREGEQLRAAVAELIEERNRLLRIAVALQDELDGVVADLDHSEAYRQCAADFSPRLDGFRAALARVGGAK